MNMICQDTPGKNFESLVLLAPGQVLYQYILVFVAGKDINPSLYCKSDKTGSVRIMKFILSTQRQIVFVRVKADICYESFVARITNPRQRGGQNIPPKRYGLLKKNMHNFDDLVYRGTSFTLNALKEVNSKVIEELQTRGSTIAVEDLQMIQLQKAILAIGLFSLFDSILQEGLSCRSGFEEAKKILIQIGKFELHNRFEDFICAINVLKHGHGKSYNTLVSKSTSLPFRLKLPGESFFYEGDISEISTLIEVDDKFVLDSAELIELVSKEIRNEIPDYCL
jgi:hypothetical protein